MNYLYWLRNDLRLIDNQALLNLSTEVRTLDIVLPWPEDFSSWGEARKLFYQETLSDFSQKLTRLGQTIYVLDQNLSQWFQNQANSYDGIVFSKSFNSRAQDLEEEVLKSFRKKEILWIDQGTIFREGDLPFSLDQLPKTFTQFRKEVESKALLDLSDLEEIKELPPPNKTVKDGLVSFNDFGLEQPQRGGPFKGGETKGWERINEYIWNRHRIQIYKESRNGMIHFDDSSKLSPWLALGALSPRSVVAEIKRYEKEIAANESTYWLYFELLWRDYFKFLAQHQKDSLFSRTGLRPKHIEEMEDQDQIFLKWREGQTGENFVDANMIELKKTGWMSNRGRQNVASYLAKTLKVDWTLGASWFESQLIDFDIESNWGNWSYLAGVGVDPRDRQFNVKRQAEIYDPNQEYQKIWLSRKEEVT